jgi:hypothetical protein
MGMQPSMGPMKGQLPQPGQMGQQDQYAMQQRAQQMLAQPRLGPAGY